MPASTRISRGSFRNDNRAVPRPRDGRPCLVLVESRPLRRPQHRPRARHRQPCQRCSGFRKQLLYFGPGIQLTACIIPEIRAVGPHRENSARDPNQVPCKSPLCRPDRPKLSSDGRSSGMTVHALDGDEQAPGQQAPGLRFPSSTFPYTGGLLLYLISPLSSAIREHVSRDPVHGYSRAGDDAEVKPAQQPPLGRSCARSL
jgi:hypothetical protein